MQCQGCGSEWFTEEKQILVREEPATPFDQARVSRVRYRYNCAECSLAFGSPASGAPEKPSRRRKKVA